MGNLVYTKTKAKVSDFVLTMQIKLLPILVVGTFAGGDPTKMWKTPTNEVVGKYYGHNLGCQDFVNEDGTEKEGIGACMRTYCDKQPITVAKPDSFPHFPLKKMQNWKRTGFGPCGNMHERYGCERIGNVCVPMKCEWRDPVDTSATDGPWAQKNCGNGHQCVLSANRESCVYIRENHKNPLARYQQMCRKAKIYDSQNLPDIGVDTPLEIHGKLWPFGKSRFWAKMGKIVRKRKYDGKDDSCYSKSMRDAGKQNNMNIAHNKFFKPHPIYTDLCCLEVYRRNEQEDPCIIGYGGDRFTDEERDPDGHCWMPKRNKKWNFDMDDFVKMPADNMGDLDFV